MKLNPLKCAFGVGFRKVFRLYSESKRHRSKLRKNQGAARHEVQSLASRVATLTRFVSRETNKCMPFFDALRVSKCFKLTKKYEQAFQELKWHLG